MCGINGIVLFSDDGAPSIEEDIGRMNDALYHRGPDDEGMYFSNENEVSIALAMRRLSIVDIEEGKQPIQNTSKNLTIVFNGEIYNYIEIRKYLLDRNMTFSTASDTEVILKLYECCGVEGFEMLEGMYAFCIHDKNLNKLLLARDYFGEKPFYYYMDDDKFIFSSEMKGLLCIFKSKFAISTLSLQLYFNLSYIPAPHTIYENVFKLTQNTVLEIDLSSREVKFNQIQGSRDTETTETTEIRGYEDAVSGVRGRVLKSVELRSRADVEVGCFLSGGVDSSIVASCLAEKSSSRIPTFSLGLANGKFDETDKALIVAKTINSNHHVFNLTESDASDCLNDVLLNFDEPFADSSAIPSHILAKQTSEFVKVVLTGDGGDEVFAGYNKYYMGHLNRVYTNIIPKRLHQAVGVKLSDDFLTSKSDSRGLIFRARRSLKSMDYDGNHYWNIIGLGFEVEELNKLFIEKPLPQVISKALASISGVSTPNNLSEYRQVDRSISLDGDLLVKVDRSAMFNSLECRSPFLSSDLWNYVEELPDKYLRKRSNKKRILKDAFKDKFPEKFLDKPKQGFGVPVGDWLRGSLKDELLFFTEKTNLIGQGLFQHEYINEMVNDHVTGRVDNTFRVWTFYCFQIWYYRKYTLS